MSDSPWFRWLERVAFAALLVFLLYRLAPQISAFTGLGAAPVEAPSFEVTTFDGRTLTSEDLRGEVVVVNFWATWCPPCRLEMPALQALHEERASDGLVVLGLATDATGEGPIRAFLEERGFTYPVARAGGSLKRAFGGITGIPTTFVLDREGRIRHRVVGYFVPPAMKSAVGRLLEEPEGRPVTGEE